MKQPPWGSGFAPGVAILGLAVAFGILWSIGGQVEQAPEGAPSPADSRPPTASKPVWTAAAWPFPTDAWGKGKAFRCPAAHCGTDVTLYLRAKIGMCGCITSIDDDGVERGSDLDLLAADRTSLGAGRPIDVRWMKGRSRTFALAGSGATARSAVAIAFHDRCDMVVATASVGDDVPQRQEAAVIEVLNRDVVLRWAEVTLGL